MKKFFILVFDKILVINRHELSTTQFMQGVWQLAVIPDGSWRSDTLLRAWQADY